MIYDPHLIAYHDLGNSHNLAIDSALGHADVPMLVAWSSATVPDAGTVRAFRTAVPWVHVASREPRPFRHQLEEFLATTPVTPMRS
jgi:hypothetical protein